MIRESLSKITRGLNKRQKWLLTGLMLLAIYTITGFVIVPLAARYIAADQISKALGRQAAIGAVRFNPFTLTMAVKDFSLKQKNPDDDMVSFKSLYVNLAWSSLFHLAPVVSNFRLETPVIHLLRDKQGVFSFSDLLPRKTDTATTAPEPEKTNKQSAPFRFSVANIEIDQGNIVFQDDTKGKTQRVENLTVGIPLVSTIGKATKLYVMPHFSADINGKPFVLGGRAKPFDKTLETDVSLALKELDLPYYMDYVPVALPVTVTSGALTISLKIAFMNTPDGLAELRLSGDMDLQNLTVADTGGRPLFSLKRLKIGLSPSHILEGEVHLSAISMAAPTIHVLRTAGGELNIYGLQPDSGASKPAEAPSTNDNNSEEATPFHVQIDTFRMSDAAVMLKDQPATKPQTEAEPAAEKIIGLARLEIVDASVDTKTREISLNEIRTSGGMLLIDRLDDGTINLQALSGPAPENKVKPPINASAVTEPTPSWSFLLKAMALNNYQIRAANLLPAGNAGAMVGLNSLALTDIKAGGSPAALKINDIQLSGLNADLHINAEGKAGPAARVEKNAGVNEQADREAAPAPHGEPFAIDINRIGLDDARFRFSDQTPPQPFQTELADVNLKITRLSSRPDQIASILFTGTLDKQAPLTISGQINPLAEDIYTNILLKFENMELSSLSPYSGEYIGRTIAKGKLFTDLNYTVKDQKLAGKNHLFIDQLELGEKVKSPDATNLPVQLAIFLLQDREGKIVLDVPVSGNLNDPSFSLGRTILKAFTNLVAKAATSPFSLVSAMLGGVDPSHLEFAYGNAEITEKLGQVIDSLSTLLYNRPGLAVELAGYVNREQDGRALTDLLFMKKLKERKLAGLTPALAQSTPVGSITIAPEEYEEYLWQAYKLETFSKPKNALGLDKKLPVEEMEALMRQHLQVDDKQLKTLANERARQVRDHILASGKVAPERVFIVETPSLTPESVKAVSNSRVDVSLKQ